MQVSLIDPKKKLIKELKGDPSRFSDPIAFAGKGADIDTSDLDKNEDPTTYAAKLCAKLGIPFSINKGNKG